VRIVCGVSASINIFMMISSMFVIHICSPVLFTYLRAGALYGCFIDWICVCVCVCQLQLPK